MPPPFQTASYHGQILHIMFETSTDISRFMPATLEPVDPHRAFIKAERLKIRSQDADGNPSAFTHYQQVCISTLATTPDLGPRHRNVLLWEDRHWALGPTPIAGKRYGSIEMTQVYETERALPDRGEPIPFFVDVETNGYCLMRFAGQLDGRERAPVPPYGRFYVGGEPGTDLLALTLDSAQLSRPLHGTGELSFGRAPNEGLNLSGSGVLWPATLLKDIRTQGCVLHDVNFTRISEGEFTRVRAATP